MSDSEFARFFERVTGSPPHRWQASLGLSQECVDRLIRIPTGFGKTAGVVLPWLFHRVERGSDAWPRPLVLTLPMRVHELSEPSPPRPLGSRPWRPSSPSSGRVGPTRSISWRIWPEGSPSTCTRGRQSGRGLGVLLVDAEAMHGE